MKALSIRQPWAWAILHAGKDIENRTWRTPVRGRILVHAAKSMTAAEWGSALGFMHDISIAKPFPAGLALPTMSGLARGALVGTVEIADCVDDMREARSPWFTGDYGFVLRNPVAFDAPIPCRGALGFFDVPDHLISNAGQRLANLEA